MTAIPVREHTLDLIGNTPLVRLEGPSAEAGCDIFGKCEFANPGASVKDRAALYIIRDAEERGELKPGGTVVEGTAGNTGIGIALVANALGYRTIIVMPDNQSKEKMDTLRALGAELVTVPPTKYADSNHFQHVSRRMAEELDGAVWAGQFDNTANRKAHIETTARELWDQLEGRIDGFTCAAGTGGTIAGVGMGLKELDETVTIALTDPHGAALYNYFASGELKAEGSSVAEGIGQDHRQSRRCADRYAVPHFGRGRSHMGRSSASRRRSVPWPFFGHHCRRGDCAGQAIGGRRARESARRHHPVRHRLPLSLDALQRRMAGREGPAGVRLVAKRRLTVARACLGSGRAPILRHEPQAANGRVARRSGQGCPA